MRALITFATLVFVTACQTTRDDYVDSGSRQQRRARLLNSMSNMGRSMGTVSNPYDRGGERPIRRMFAPVTTCKKSYDMFGIEVSRCETSDW